MKSENEIFPKEIETNYYPTDFGLNVVSGPGGSVMAGGAMQSPNYNLGNSGWAIRAAGSAEFTDLYVTGYVKTVSVGGSIQEAIDILNAHGGGTVQLDAGTHTLTDDITLYSGISINGAGRDSTILEFSGAANGILAIGTSSAIKKNFTLSNFTLQNSNNTAGIDIDYCDFFKLENIRVTSCDQGGIRVQYSRDFSFSNVLSDENGGVGIDIFADGTRPGKNFYLENCVANSNTGDGWDITATRLSEFTLIQCVADDNGGHGFDINGGAVIGFVNASLVSCRADSNTGNGFYLDIKNLSCLLCSSTLNGSYGFSTKHDGAIFAGCLSSDNTSGDFQDISTGSGLAGSMIACRIGDSSTTDPNSLVDMYTEDTFINMTDMLYGSMRQIRKVAWMENVSGGTITEGSVTTLASTSSENEVTTTTTRGDSKVFGMKVIGGSHFNATWSNYLVTGFTESLKVNGTDDIAIGDYLTTFTTAGIASKARTGDQVFAIALEAYTANDSSGVIDAYLLPWRFPLWGSGTDAIAGAVELATTTEVNTGTDTGRVVTPDTLAGSYAGTKTVEVVAFDFTTNTAVGDGAAYFRVPASMAGMDLVAVAARVITAGTTNTTDIQIHNLTQTADMLSTKITIDSTEVDSSTAATPAVIDTGNDDVASGDLIRVDVDAVSTTPAKGLIVSMEFRLP